MTIGWNGISKRKRLSAVSGAVVLAAVAVAFPLCRSGHVQAAQEKEGARAAQDQATSLNDQTDLAVTVYNSNIALVRDVRNLSLPGGLFRLKFMDIAATVNPATVHFRDRKSVV